TALAPERAALEAELAAMAADAELARITLARNDALTERGFRSVAAQDEAREHLDMFVQFILVNDLDDELRDRRWADFARIYNGPGYAANRYDVKMAAAYAKHAAACAREKR
ncbi:MAG: N-acetylmuramidase domain-containing protein, partial [Erythrobacter sp.]